MHVANRSLTALSLLLVCAGTAVNAQSATPTEPAQPAQKAEAAEPADAPPQGNDEPARDVESRADLRTFGGSCIENPSGKNRQMGALIAAVLPQVIGAGVDALTSALNALGRDRPLAQSAVVPLEHGVRCVQVAREVPRVTATRTLQEAVADAPFMLEFHLRQSWDGSALLVTPTRLNYRETLDRRQTRRNRTLYATLTFADPSGERSSTVTVPIGRYATSAAPRRLDPVGEPSDPKGFSSLGAGNSVWIPNPFRVAAGAEPAAPPQNQAAQSGTKAQDGFGGATQVRTTPGPTTRQASPPPQPAVTNARVEQGQLVAPVSITVAITEIRPGSAFARALATVLGGARDEIVSAIDPTQRAAARAEERTAAATLLTTLVEARVKYAQALQAYCNPEAPATRMSEAPDLYGAQMGLIAAARAASAETSLPFTALVNPETGEGEVCPN